VTPRAVIVGPPGSGKSTIGPLLAERLGVSFRDSDEDIVEQAGKPISDVFTEEGEPAFRAQEEQAIAKALAEHEGVLSVGGGAVLSAATRAAFAGQTVVFLNVGMAAGLRRVGLSTARPLLAGINPRATYKSLLDARLPFYREVATVEIDTDERTPSEVVEAVTALLDSLPAQ
jgi:shikimate kinase